jgi:hypothetical protein
MLIIQSYTESIDEPARQLFLRSLFMWSVKVGFMLCPLYLFPNVWFLTAELVTAVIKIKGKSVLIFVFKNTL